MPSRCTWKCWFRLTKLRRRFLSHSSACASWKAAGCRQRPEIALRCVRLLRPCAWPAGGQSEAANLINKRVLQLTVDSADGASVTARIEALAQHAKALCNKGRYE